MTQEQINYLFNITILIHENEWFGDTKKKCLFGKEKKIRRDREEVQEWVAKKLAETMEVYTIPVGMSWGSLVDKETFDKYWSENSKIDG